MLDGRDVVLQAQDGVETVFISGDMSRPSAELVDWILRDLGIDYRRIVEPERVTYIERPWRDKS